MPLADGEDRDLRAPLLGDGLDGGGEGKRRKEDEAEERDAAILVDESNASDDAEGGVDVYTVDDAVNSLGAGWFQVLLLVVVGLCCIGEGGNATIAAFVSPAVRRIACLNVKALCFKVSLKHVQRRMGRMSVKLEEGWRGKWKF